MDEATVISGLSRPEGVVSSCYVSDFSFDSLALIFVLVRSNKYVLFQIGRPASDAEDWVFPSSPSTERFAFPFSGSTHTHHFPLLLGKEAGPSGARFHSTLQQSLLYDIIAHHHGNISPSHRDWIVAS